MTRKLLPSSYYVPAGNVPYEEKDVIWFTPYGQGLPLVALKNYSIAVPNGTRLAIHEVSNHFTNIKLRTIVSSDEILCYNCDERILLKFSTVAWLR